MARFDTQIAATCDAQHRAVPPGSNGSQPERITDRVDMVFTVDRQAVR